MFYTIFFFVKSALNVIAMSSSSTSDDERVSNSASADERSGDSSDESGEDFEAGIEPYQFEPEWPSLERKSWKTI